MLGQALTELGRKHAAPRGLGEALPTRDDGYLIDPARILSRS